MNYGLASASILRGRRYQLPIRPFSASFRSGSRSPSPKLIITYRSSSRRGVTPPIGAVDGEVGTLDQGSACHFCGWRRARHRAAGWPHRGAGCRGAQSNGAECRNIRCRRTRGSAGPHQYASSFLSDPYPGRSSGARPRTVSLAAGAVSDLGSPDAAGARSRHDPGDGRTGIVRLHHDDGPSLCLSRRARGRHRHRSGGGATARLARLVDARVDEPFAARWRLASGQRRAGRGRNPGRQRARGGALSRGRPGRHGADRACPLLAIFGHDLADAFDGEPGRPTERTHAHSSCRDRRREPLLRRDPSLPPARLSGELRLAQRSGLACARHSFRRRRDQAAGARRNDDFTLSLQQPEFSRPGPVRSAPWSTPA